MSDLRMNGLHHAAYEGSIEQTVALLSQGSIDIDESDRKGFTPLMYTAVYAQPLVAKILVSKGANVSLVCGGGLTALHYSVYSGNVDVAKVLVNAGADPEGAPVVDSFTPLHIATNGGHWEVMRVLIEAGANVDSLAGENRTPLFIAALEGHVDAARELLRAKANPVLRSMHPLTGKTWLPLDIAAFKGHLEVIKEMVRHVGIEGCGGACGGVHALALAAEGNHVDILAILTDAGVVDTGEALFQAAGFACVSSVKMLLRKHKGQSTGEEVYANATHAGRKTALSSSIWHCRSGSPKVVRLLVDAGADTTSAVPLEVTSWGEVEWSQTPLALTNVFLDQEIVGDQDATEQQLNNLTAIRRLLLQVEAVHAVSWLWHSGAAERAITTTTPSTQLTLMMPVLRRRAARRGVLLAALCRQSSKP